MRRRWLRRSEEGLDFISRRVQANSELPSTAFALNTSYSPSPPPPVGGGGGGGKRRGGEGASLKHCVGPRQGWSVYAPISQRVSETHICHMNYTKNSRKYKC